MSSITEKEKKLSEKQVKAVKADFNIEEVKDIYGVKEDDIAEMIVDDLKENDNVMDYNYSLAQVREVETELYMNATLEDPEGKSSVKQKAIDSFLDRVKGKPMQKQDITTNGESLNILLSSEIVNRDR